jgi:hypothetical protein
MSGNSAMSRPTCALFIVLLDLLLPALLPAQTACSAEIQFTNPKPTLAGGRVELNLFSTVSRPSGCMPAEIRLMAAFYDADQNLICSGVIENIAQQNAHLQSTNIELRPLNIVEFARLRTSPAVAAKRLFCMVPEGDVEAAPNQVMAAAALRLRATILPRNGGVATSEVRFSF